jgi:hypothetical protein
MKTSKFYWDKKNNKIEIWNEEVNGTTLFWMKTNGISTLISRRQYNNRLRIIESVKKQEETL